MKFKVVSFLLVMYTLSMSCKAQIPDTVNNSFSDSVQLELLKGISNDIVIHEMLKIQRQIIDNFNYMMDYIYYEQKNTQIKLDSILNILQTESKSKRPKKKNKSKKD